MNIAPTLEPELSALVKAWLHDLEKVVSFVPTLEPELSALVKAWLHHLEHGPKPCAQVIRLREEAPRRITRKILEHLRAHPDFAEEAQHVSLNTLARHMRQRGKTRRALKGKTKGYRAHWTTSHRPEGPLASSVRGPSEFVVNGTATMNSRYSDPWRAWASAMAARHNATFNIPLPLLKKTAPRRAG